MDVRRTRRWPRDVRALSSIPAWREVVYAGGADGGGGVPRVSPLAQTRNDRLRRTLAVN